MVSGLKVNFNKSSLVGISVDKDYMVVATDFLRCKIGTTPFTYLGVPVGANPSKASTWTKVIDKVANKLAGWKHKHVSFGGRVILINSVLSAMHLYMFSLYKAPKRVISSLIKIQRDFLWGHGKGKGIPWVARDDICKPKTHGGLGIKNLFRFNEALLGKWKWRSLVEVNALWAKIIKSKYGYGQTAQVSRWWLDLNKIGLEWFDDKISKSVGNGASTTFWHDVWNGSEPLKSRFPRLYMLNINKDALIQDCGVMQQGTWVWNMHWRRRLFEWEADAQVSLYSSLSNFTFNSNKPDEWRWSLDKNGAYTVGSAYAGLITSEELSSQDNLLKPWLKQTPFNVSCFMWKLLRRRLPVMEELARRNIAGVDSMECVFCINNHENIDHLFIQCPFSSSVWNTIYKWLDSSYVTVNNVEEAIEKHDNMSPSKNKEKVWRIFWIATTWSLWLLRNDVIFNDGNISFMNIIHSIKVKSWMWFIRKGGNIGQFLFSNWCTSPKTCIMST